MKKKLVMGLANGLFILGLVGGACVAQAVQGQGQTVALSPMPAERAKATFEDERVKTFMSVVANNFGGKCNIPDYTNTEAILTYTGGDYPSSFYRITIPCTGSNGLAGVEINAEFYHAKPRPLDLTLSLRFKQ